MNIRTGNPTLKNTTFDRFRGQGLDNGMTIQGTVNKTLLLLLFLMITSIYSWNAFSTNPSGASLLMIGGAIGGFVVGLVTIFIPKISPITAPIYALLQGCFIGAISAYYNTEFEGIVIQAILLTFGTLFSLLLAYKSGWIKVTQKSRLGIFAATGAIFVVYLISFIGRFFGFTVPHLHEATPIGILISVVIVIIAALNLVLDFDYIDTGAKQNVPKYFEWYAGFGLMVTLIWLYIEILRLLAKIRSRK